MSEDSTLTDAELIAQREAKAKARAEKRAALEKQRAAQEDLDLDALDALRDEHGYSNVEALDVAFTPGLPTMIVVRTPSAAELKRYQSRCKAKRDGTPGDALAAAEELAQVCCVYPDRETLTRLIAERPGVLPPCGIAAVKLSTASQDDSVKR